MGHQHRGILEQESVDKWFELNETNVWVRCDKLIKLKVPKTRALFLRGFLNFARFNRVCKFEGLLRKFAETLTGY